ncbi:MAG: L,D-transpeptidase [Verrucomicrobiaceae bacterium]|nr:L,D-transpeptidase [Verrucomicrobiaceae bacterium]
MKTISSLLRLSSALAAATLLCQCTAGKVTRPDVVVVSVKDQRMGLYEGGELKKKYKVSTSKFGLGSAPGSYQTPLGRHQIVSKIGEGLPTGAVLKGRSWNGEVLTPNAPGRDPVVSRILWLSGREKTNRNTQNRLIYIHGTPEERSLGRPASYGCIRMGMKDVISAFGEIPVGTQVVITEGGLGRHAMTGEAN